MSSYYIEIQASGIYYDLDLDAPLELSFLDRRRSALEMILKQIEHLRSDREDMFFSHKSELEQQISELQLRFKQLMPGNQIHYPARAIFEIESHKILLEKELRDKEVQFWNDILNLDDRIRTILLDFGTLLEIGDKNGMERQGRGTGTLQETKALSERKGG